MPRIIPLPYRKVDRILRTHGFLPARQTGSHVRYQHADGRACTVPRHEGTDVTPKLLRKIAREAGMEPDVFRA